MGSLFLSPIRGGFTILAPLPRSMLSQVLMREEIAIVQGDIERLTSVTLERFHPEASYEAHVESLTPPLRLDPEHVSVLNSFTCVFAHEVIVFYLFLTSCFP